MSASHCLHFVVVVFAKRGTPQLLMISFRMGKVIWRDGTEPFCAEELVTLVEGVDV